MEIRKPIRAIRPAIEGSGREHVIIFIHGLGGRSKKTWGKMLSVFGSDPNFFRCSLDCYQYPTRLINLPYLSPPPGLPEIAEGLKTFIEDRYQDFAQIDLVAHSMGGIIVRQFIVDQQNKGWTTRINKVAMIAVPNSGSSLASVAKKISWRHRQLKALSKNAVQLSSLQQSWRALDIESKVSVRYLVGGSDRCVPRKSACIEPGTSPSMLINAGHRDIVVPKNIDDERYTVLATFLQSTMAKKITSIRAGDPLFEYYSPEQEEYYICRETDARLSESISAGHLWLCGASGVGKSATLRRAVYQNGWSLSHLNLSSYQDQSPLGMIIAIADELSLLTMDEAAALDERSFEAACRSIRSNLAALCAEQVCAIVVEEIPLGEDELPEFLELLTRLLQIVSGSELIHNRVIFAFSSIAELSTVADKISGKVRECVQIMSAPSWVADDIGRLVRMLNSELKQNLTEKKMGEIVMEADGSPRFVKALLRQYRNGTAEGISWSQLLRRVKSEQS